MRHAERHKFPNLFYFFIFFIAFGADFMNFVTSLEDTNLYMFTFFYFEMISCRNKYSTKNFSLNDAFILNILVCIFYKPGST